ncbi:MAG: 50S ribosomal protein L14e [Nanoarchaeota archaeon]
MEVGRLIVKTAGRDSGKIGVIIDIIDKNHVLIDGQVRRKKCNIQHIEILDQKIKIKQKATTDNVIKELKELKIDARKTKSKPKKERPIRQRKQKERTEEKPKKEKKVKKEKKNER